MNRSYLLMGGNVGDRLKNLEDAVMELEKHSINVVQKSKVYETEAWGLRDQPLFLNMVVEVESKLDSRQLLDASLSIEEKLGRKRTVKFGPRLIDLDILLFNEEIINLLGLTIPHPELAKRRFALTPLHELAPNYLHPVLKKTVSEMLSDCPDKLEVKIFSC